MNMRYPTEELIAQINARLPDNDTGAISPAVMRSMLIDMVMSLRGTAAYMLRQPVDGNINHTFSTTSYEKISGLFVSGVARDPTEVNFSTALQQFTAAVAGDYVLWLYTSIAGSSNERVNIAAAIDGIVQTQVVAQSQLIGSTSFVSIGIQIPMRLAAGQIVDVRFAFPTAPATIDLSQSTAMLQLVPSRI